MTLSDRTATIAVMLASIVAMGIGLVGLMLAPTSTLVETRGLRAALVVAAVGGTAGVVGVIASGSRRGRRSTGGDGAARPPRETGGPSGVQPATGQDGEREEVIESSRRALLAWMAHDLRGPLEGIRAAADALDDGGADDPAVVALHLGMVRRETDRLAVMIDDLSELSQVDVVGSSFDLEPADLADLASDAIAAAGPPAEVRRVGEASDREAPAPEVADGHHGRPGETAPRDLDVEKRHAFDLAFRVDEGLVADRTDGAFVPARRLPER